MESTVLGVQYVVGFVLVLSSLPKFRSRDEFARAVSNYRLLPPSLVSPVALWLPRAELVAGAGLLLGIAVTPIASLVTVMLLCFALAVAWNLLHGRRIECGCAGNAAPRMISWKLVTRDVGLAGLALAVAVAAPATVTDLGRASDASTVVPTGDAFGLLVTAALVVIGEALVVDGRRTRNALRRLDGDGVPA